MKPLHRLPVGRIFWPPSLVARQAGSALLFWRLTGWKSFPRWLVRHSLPSLPVAAGSIGMGCIGYPAHPAWEVTGACNLRCIHCHASSGRPAPDELTTAEAKRFIDELAKVAEFRTLVYTGGEPLVRHDIFDLLDHSRRRGFINILATNGTLIDDAMAKRLKKAGVAGAAVSLDSCQEEIHDRIRSREGAFDQALRGMRAVRKAGILLQVNTTAMDYNFDTLMELMELADREGSGIMLMYQLVPVGRGGEIEKASLKTGENERLLRYLAERQQKVSTMVEPVAGPQYWAHLMELAGKTGPIWRKMARKVFHGCAAGRGFVYIKANGDVWPCPFVEISAGSVRERSFGEIWREADLFRQLRNRETGLKGKCGECGYRAICGGCRGRAVVYHNDVMAEDPSCFIEAGRGMPLV